jgi:hypothetical protein
MYLTYGDPATVFVASDVVPRLTARGPAWSQRPQPRELPYIAGGPFPPSSVGATYAREYCAPVPSWPGCMWKARGACVTRIHADDVGVQSAPEEQGATTSKSHCGSHIRRRRGVCATGSRTCPPSSPKCPRARLRLVIEDKRSGSL